jgi:uncharacterized repeat protein (TIGR01451 family)
MSRAGTVGVISILLFLLTSMPTVRLAAWPANDSFRPGAVLVGMRPVASLAIMTQLLADRGLQVEHALTPLPIVSVQVPIGQELATAESLRRVGQVAFAELDYAAHSTEVITPTDPGWINQWGPRQIEAPAAWAVVTGTSRLIIALVDSGLKLDHEDLASQRWINSAEIPDNFIDDDGNGKIDDVNGWHFYQVFTGSTYVPAENADVQDDYGHGTHVAGIAAAAMNNHVGIVGLAPGARVMPVKVLDQFGTGWYSDIAAGIVYAADNGAQIINLSLGGAEDSQTLRAAIDYVQARGALVVAATGNTGGMVLYPAAYESVLAVAATDQNDQVAYFSNRGPQVDVAAPGVDIYSTWPWRDGYFTKSGTSMASPHVSGLAALIWTARPDLSAAMVRRVITSTVNDIGPVGWDESVGWGRVNANAAVALVRNPVTLVISSAGNGVIAQVPEAPYAFGDVVTLTATAGIGSGFSSWSGALSGTTNPLTITLDSNKVVTATFARNPVSLTINTVGNGTVLPAPAGPYLYGDVVTLTASGASLWNFAEWSGALSGSTNPATITLDGDKVVTATLCIVNYGVDFDSTYPTTLSTLGNYTITYQTVVHNNGVLTTTNVGVTYTLDSGLNFVSLVAQPAVGTVTTTVPGWSIASLNPGEAVTLTLVTTGRVSSSTMVETVLTAYDGQIVRGPWFMDTDVMTYRTFLPILHR